MDQSTSKIERINYDGSARELVWSASNITHSSNLHPYGLNLFEDHLFFMTPNGVLKKCKLYGSLQCDDIRLHRNTINHFVIAQDSRQFNLPNVCVGHNCSYLCIQSEVGIKCVCENGNVIQENEMCDPSTVCFIKNSIRHLNLFFHEKIFVKRKDIQRILHIEKLNLVQNILGYFPLWCRHHNIILLILNRSKRTELIYLRYATI